MRIAFWATKATHTNTHTVCNSVYLKRRQLAGKGKRVSEQILKTVYQFYKLHRLRKTVKEKSVQSFLRSCACSLHN